MKAGFWNINKGRTPLELIPDFAQLNETDFLILFESGYSPVNILHALNSKNPLFYHYYFPFTSDFIQIFTTFSSNLLKDIDDEDRKSAKEYTTPLNQYFGRFFCEEKRSVGLRLSIPFLFFET